MVNATIRARATANDRTRLENANNGSGPVVPPTDDSQLNGSLADDVIAAKLAALGLGHITPAQYNKPSTTKPKKAGRRATVLAGNPLVDDFINKTLAEIKRQCDLIDSGEEKIRVNGAMFAGTNKEFAAFKRFLNPAKGEGWLDEQETAEYTVTLVWSMADIPGAVAASSNTEDADEAVVYLGYPTVTFKDIPADEDESDEDNNEK